MHYAHRSFVIVALLIVVVTCPSVNSTLIPPNAQIIAYTLGNIYGSMAVLLCKNNLQLSNGMPYLMCQSNGMWSTTTATCAGRLFSLHN